MSLRSSRLLAGFGRRGLRARHQDDGLSHQSRRQRRHLSRGARQLLPEQGGAAGPHLAADFAARQSGLSARSGDYRGPAAEGLALRLSVAYAFQALILVSHDSPNRLDWPVRWRTGDRLILGPISP